MKKFLNVLFGLKFGILLFLLIAAYSIIGTVIPQEVSAEYYLHQYPKLGNMMLLLQMDHVYSSAIFLALVAAFIINLAGCTAKILPGQWKRMQKTYTPAPGKKSENLYEKGVDTQALQEALRKKRFHIVEKDGGYYAAKHRIGAIGSSITHLGIIVIILGGFVGNLLAIDGSISLKPGQETVFHENNFSVVVDDFFMEFREDNSVSQYFSELSIYENGAKTREETIWVNNPLAHNGLDLYQSYYGWSGTLEIRDEADALLAAYDIENNQHHVYEPKSLRVFLYGFFPDFTMDATGTPVTRSQKMQNPYFAAVLYDYDGYVDSYIVQPGEAIPYEDVQVVFHSPVLYTGIVYRQDVGYKYVLAGTALMLLGLVLSFYFYPKYICVTPNSITPITRQNNWGLTMQVKAMLQKQQNDRNEAKS